MLVLAGENDPRCPIRQIDNYLAALAAGQADEVYRFDAGHGSLVVEETMRHAADRGRVRPTGLRAVSPQRATTTDKRVRHAVLANS